MWSAASSSRRSFSEDRAQVGDCALIGKRRVHERVEIDRHRRRADERVQRTGLSNLPEGALVAWQGLRVALTTCARSHCGAGRHDCNRRAPAPSTDSAGNRRDRHPTESLARSLLGGRRSTKRRRCDGSSAISRKAHRGCGTSLRSPRIWRDASQADLILHATIRGSPRSEQGYREDSQWAHWP